MTTIKKLKEQLAVSLSMSVHYYQLGRMIRATTNYETAELIASVLKMKKDDLKEYKENICDMENVSRFEWEQAILGGLIKEDRKKARKTINAE